MAAGLGFKTFTTGEVLTAADVNGYLMQGVLVFASEAARDAAITSPQEGQFAFTKDNNSLWYYTGSAWAASGATGDIEGVTAGVGISGGGTSGTVTITNSMATEIDAKGDLVVGTGADTFARLPVGTNGYTLVADSSVSPTGLKWAAPGKLVQVVNTQTGTAATGTTIMPNDGTIPQNTEGTQFMTLSITPTNTNNKLFIQVVTRQQVTGSNKDIVIALFQDATAGALAANNYRQTGDTVAQLGVLNYYMTAGTTSSTEFKVRIGSADAGTVTFCPNAAGQIASSTITISEIAV